MARVYLDTRKAPAAQISAGTFSEEGS